MATITPINDGDSGFTARTAINTNDANLNNDKLETSLKGSANGLAELDGNTKVPLAQLPQGSLERLVTVVDQSARFSLTTNDVQNGDSVKQLDNDLLYVVVDDTNLNNASGYVQYSASTDWALISSIPSNISEIEGITKTNDEIIQVKSGSYTSRTPAQFKTDLSLTKGDVDLSNVENLKVNLTATVDPTATDDSGSGYAIGSRWINTSNDKEYVCVDSTAMLAVWKETTQLDTNITNLGYTPSATDGTITSSTGTDATIPLVTPTAGSNEAGLLSPADKTKLDGIETGATANQSDAQLLDRANHTGTQTASTISDFDTEVSNNSAVTANTAKVSNATHTGDVTGSTALTISENSVTFAKMQNAIGNSKLVGSGDMGAGADYSELTLGTNLSISGTTLNASGGSVDSVFTRTGAITAQSGDYNAGQITNTPAGNIAATNVQAAINELDTEKAEIGVPSFTYSTAGSTITPDLTYSNKLVKVDAAGAQTFYLPDDATLDFPDGTVISVTQMLSDNPITFAPGPTSTIFLAAQGNRLTTNGQYATASALKIGGNGWLVTGNLIV